MTVSAGGMLGEPKLVLRPGFRIAGRFLAYNCQDNLLRGTPLLDGIEGYAGCSLVVGHWFTNNGVNWNGGFLETVGRARCAADCCEVTLSCFAGAI